MSGEAGGSDETLAQGLLSLVGYGPVVGEHSALQFIKVGGGELHATSRAVSILIVTSLPHTDRHKLVCHVRSTVSILMARLHIKPSSFQNNKKYIYLNTKERLIDALSGLVLLTD